jgi:hypothetical protein
MTKAPKRPRDLKQWAKRMVDIATGELSDREQEGNRTILPKAPAPTPENRPKSRERLRWFSPLART